MFLPGQASRVDVLGTAGVGKSWLCRRFLKQSKAWISVEQARLVAIEMALRYGAPSMGIHDRFIQCAIALRHSIRLFVRGWGDYTDPSAGQLFRIRDGELKAFLEEHEGLFEAVGGQWFDPEIPLPDLPNRYREMLRWTSDLLFYSRWAGRVRILADNARFTKAIAELLANNAYTEEKRKDLVSSYLNSPLVPVAVIHFFGSPDLILERIRKREAETNGWMHPAHEGLSDRELLGYTTRRQRINTSAAEHLKSKGIPVLDLDVDSATRSSLGRLEQFLASLTESPGA